MSALPAACQCVGPWMSGKASGVERAAAHDLVGGRLLLPLVNAAPRNVTSGYPTSEQLVRP
jgi:hypothetical protein